MSKEFSDRERKLIQAAFDRFESTYVHRDDLLGFSKEIAQRTYKISGICKKYLAEEHRPTEGYFQLPTIYGGQWVVDDPDKYATNDRAFEAEHNIGARARRLRENQEPMQVQGHFAD
jgi:hypothetical protein